MAHLPSFRRLTRAFIVTGVVGLAALYLKAYVLLIPLAVGVAFYLFSDSYDRMSAWLSVRPTAAKFTLSWLWAFAVGLALAFFVAHFVVSLTTLTVPGEGPALCLIYRLEYGIAREGDDPDRYHRTERLGVMHRGDRAWCDTPEGPLALRLSALPGDTVTIVDNALYIGGDLQDASQVVASYAIGKRVDEATLQGILAAQVGPDEHRVNPDQVRKWHHRLPTPYDSTLTVRLPVQMRAQLWDEETYSPLFANLDDQRIYPHNPYYLWNAAQWGPMRMPRRGDKIRLDPANVALYGPLVMRQENHELSVDSAATYTFRQSYYLALSDDRDLINDCRSYGPLPEAKIVSRAYLLFHEP